MLTTGTCCFGTPRVSDMCVFRAVRIHAVPCAVRQNRSLLGSGQPLLRKQLYSVGVQSLLIISVSGVVYRDGSGPYGISGSENLQCGKPALA